MWLAAYLGAGLIFAIAFKELPQCLVTAGSGGCERGFWNLIYFSLSNQSTLTYGDYVPTGVGRLLVIVQGFVGLTMNALVLGVVVFKALKRSNPLIFSRYLVYELEKHKFWFRFVNVDADRLREVDVRVQLVQIAGPGSRTDYDTQANKVQVDVEHFPDMPRLRLFADRSKSNEGKAMNPASDFEEIVLAPGHFSRPTTRYVEMTMRGYFESTGDMFFYTGHYTLGDVRCGAFDGVDNNALEGKSDSEKARELSKKLDHVIPKSAENCLACPHHQVCQFDIALKTRAKFGAGLGRGVR